jgi:hypothetical protein
MERRSVLIIESIPQYQDPAEGDMLSEVLEMASTDYFELHTISNKSDLLDMLEDRAFMRRFKIVHLSGHGDEEEPNFLLPRGSINASAFPRTASATRRSASPRAPWAREVRDAVHGPDQGPLRDRASPQPILHRCSPLLSHVLLLDQPS